MRREEIEEGGRVKKDRPRGKNGKGRKVMMEVTDEKA